MARFVIYSALVGKYDNVSQPLAINDDFDYVLFSNDILKSNVGIWSIRRFEYYNPDSTRVCRYIKTHPELLMPEYEFYVWIDLNVQIQTDFIYQQAIYLYNQRVIASGMFHPYRGCIYEEGFAVMNMIVEHENVVVDWCHFLRKERYPRKNGLVETNVLFRINDEATQSLNRLWWDCINNYSRRDQLSFNYCLWKLNIPLVYFSGEGKNTRNTDDFKLVKHNNEYHNLVQLKTNEAWLMRYCWKKKQAEHEIEELYYRLYSRHFPKIWVTIAGQLYRIKYLFETLRSR